MVQKGHRLFFMVPWKQYTYFGTTHTVFTGNVNQWEATEKEIDDFIAEINAAYPPADLKRDDVCFVNAGLLPMNEPNGRTQDVSLLKQHMIWDPEQDAGIRGLLSIVGVKLTEARHVAEKVVDLACRKLEEDRPKSQTAFTPVDGGNIDNLDLFLNQEISKREYGLPSQTIRHLVHNYGSAYTRVLKLLEVDRTLGTEVSKHSPVIQAEVLHAVREEMAMTLSDVVHRRTMLGLLQKGELDLQGCAEIMAKELGWDRARVQREVEHAEKK